MSYYDHAVMMALKLGIWQQDEIRTPARSGQPRPTTLPQPLCDVAKAMVLRFLSRCQQANT